MYFPKKIWGYEILENTWPFQRQLARYITRTQVVAKTLHVNSKQISHGDII